MGQSDLEMTLRYAHLTPDHKAILFKKKQSLGVMFTLIQKSVTLVGHQLIKAN